MDNRTYAIALIGSGFIGGLHAKNIAAHSRTVLRYLVEPNLAVGTELAARYEAKLVDSVDEALADEDLDAVWIASPANTHSDLIRKAAKAGKAIFCEKPVGVELDDVRRLLDELRAYSKPILIGFNRRFDHSHERLKQLVDVGKVGKVEMVVITSRDPQPPPIDYMRIAPGGIFYDTMIHDFDMARWLLGEEPTEIYATASTHLGAVFNPDGEADAATATMKTASGAVCQIVVSRRAVFGYDQRIEVFGSEGMVQSENQAQNHVRIYGKEAITSDPLKTFFTDRYAEAYVREIDVFVDALEGKPVSFPDLYDGREALALSMDALESARTGRPVACSPAPKA